MTQTTVAGRQTARATSGTFLGVTVTTQPPYGKWSVHDCADPGQVSALNCIFPQNFAVNDSTSGGIKVKNGITIHTLEPAPSASFTVNHGA